MPTDKTYEQGGAATEAGNFPRENGIGSAYLRLQVAKRESGRASMSGSTRPTRRTHRSPATSQRRRPRWFNVALPPRLS
jgi:hypothetical protein